MIDIVKRKINMTDELRSKIKWACTFNNCVPNVKVNIKLIKKYKIKLIKKFNVVFPENVNKSFTFSGIIFIFYFQFLLFYLLNDMMAQLFLLRLNDATTYLELHLLEYYH